MGSGKLLGYLKRAETKIGKLDLFGKIHLFQKHKSKLCSKSRPHVEAINGDKSIPNLVSLGPEYDEDQHGTYLALLEDALNKRELRNVALSGPYGCGKSSILAKYKEEHQDEAIAVSLWSLAPPAQNQASKSSNTSSNHGEGISWEHETTTAMVEREIVRQLLYCGDPSRATRSRFNRMHPDAASSVLIRSLSLVVLCIAAFLFLVERICLNLLAPWGWAQRRCASFVSLPSY